MEFLAIIALGFVERSRFDLPLRRRWAGRSLALPALPLRVPVAIALAGTDVRRWALRLSTALLLVWSWFLLTADGAERASDGVNFLIGYYLAFLGLGVLGIVAATSGRDRGNELLDSLPAGPRQRVLGFAWLLVVLAGVEYVLLLISRYLRPDLPYAEALPGPWELTQGPLMLLGAGLLGLLLARWVPGWVAAPVGVVAAVVWTVWIGRDGSSLAMLGPVVEWAEYLDEDVTTLVFEEGSFGWHNAYLLGLCGLGLVAALLSEPGRRRGLIACGTVLAAATVVAGLLAVP